MIDFLEQVTNCSHYSAVATDFAQTWQQYASSSDPAPHYKMSFNVVPGVKDSWSIKYNLLWQPLLGLGDKPFPWEKVAGTELSYYASRANRFGVPMDPRHTYVKTDWLSWAAAMASTMASPATNVTFEAFMSPIFDAVNTTESRQPFTDLYDTTNAVQTFDNSFVARPVIGGIFAHALVQEGTGQTN